MISSVQSFNSIEQKPFNDFSKNGEYYITKETANDIFVTKEQDKKKRGLKIGLIVAGSSIVATLGVIGITKGVPKTVHRYLANLAKRLENNINVRKQNGQSGPVTFFLQRLNKQVNKLSKRGESINNINTYKDLLFQDVMYKTKPTQKIHRRITSFFEKLAYKTVDKGYENASNKFGLLKQKIAGVNNAIKLENPHKKITINGITKNASEWLSEASERFNRVLDNLHTNFEPSAREIRYNQMKSANVGLDKKVWDVSLNGAKEATGVKSKIAAIKSSQMHQSFIAEDLLAQNKLDISNQVSAARRKITYDINDAHKAGVSVVDNMLKSITPEDAESRRLIKTLHSKLNTYKKLSGPQEIKYREEIKDDIFKISEDVTKRVQDGSKQLGYTPQATKQILDAHVELQDVLNSAQKGEIQELLTIYKALLSRGEYEQLRKIANNATKSLDDAIHTESDLFFDKLRDLSLGSAPTDVLSLVGSVAGVGVGLSFAKDKDERVSALLNYGIPIVGSLATTVVLTLGLVAGFKSLLIGTLSGAAMSGICSFADKKRKAHNKELLNEQHAQTVKEEIQKQQLSNRHRKKSEKTQAS